MSFECKCKCLFHWVTKLVRKEIRKWMFAQLNTKFVSLKYKNELHFFVFYIMYYFFSGISKYLIHILIVRIYQILPFLWLFKPNGKDACYSDSRVMGSNSREDKKGT